MPRTTTRLAAVSILVAILVFGLKYYAAHITGSVALYSDALESIVNLVTALATLAAVTLAARPANAAMPFGYHKAEYFSAVIEGVAILVAALMIFAEAWRAFTNPGPLTAPYAGLAVTVAASVINGIWCAVLIRAGRRHRSPALAADGQHLLTDVITSVGVVAGLILVYLTGWLILDAIIAVIVAINILWAGARLIFSSVSGLMDVALPPERVEKITAIISEHAGGAIEAHDVRTREAGAMTFIEFHLVVPGQMSVADAHAICDRIEAALRAEEGRALITIHVEPEQKAKHDAVRVP